MDTVVRIKKGLKWTGIVLGGLIVFVVLINAFDEELSPEAQALLKPPVDTVPPEENGFYYLMGINAPRGVDPYELGRKIVVAHNDAVSKWASAGGIAEKLAGPAKVKIKGEAFSVCNLRKQKCLDQYVKERVLIRRLASQNILLLARANRLLQYRHYRGTAVLNFDFLTPTYSYAFQNLRLAQIGLKVREGKLSQALKQLEKDARFWRMSISESRTLIGKLVGTSYLTMDLRLLSEIIARYQLSPAQASIAQRILQPLSAEALSSKAVLNSERAFTVRSLLYVDNLSKEDRELIFEGQGFLSSTLQGHFYKPNASANRYIRILASYGLVEHTAPAPKLLDYVQNVLDVKQQEHGGIGLDIIYNPVGKIVIAISSSFQSYIYYAARPHNLDCTRRLVVTQLDLKTKRLPVSKITAYLAALPKDLRNPYNGNSPAWDAKAKSISFMCMARDSEAREKSGILSQKIEVEL